MSVNAYYRDELAYLREMGALFSRANPRLSRFLSRDSTDPDVERLLEGFAFLTARLSHRLDLEMPELSHGLLQLIWPHYLRPVPPVTTIAFRPARGASVSTIHVPRGTTVQTAPVDGEPLIFRTSFDVTVLPFAIVRAELENRIDSCRLTLGFQRVAGADLKPLAQAPFRLFLNPHADAGISRRLYYFLLEHVREVRFAAGQNEGVPAQVTIDPVGFQPDEATIPYPSGAFQGFRILQEYFACPEKFMHIGIGGLEAFASAAASSFALSFEMGRRFPGTARLTPDHFAINATPAVNLFEAEGQAQAIAHERSEYPVTPIGGRDKRSVHSVESVTGWVQGSGQRIDYERFENFRHDAPRDDGERLYFRTRIRPAVVGKGVDHYLSFVTGINETGVPRTETVSVQLACSNAPLISRMGIGSVSRPTASTPAKLEIANITPVLSEVPPPLDDGTIWTLISNLARNFSSLIDIEALRTVISAYDFRANTDRHAAQQRELLLNSLHRFERRGVDVVRRGRPVRAQELVLTLSEQPMGGEGEVYLFGTILDRFLKSYASINSMHRFSILCRDTNARFGWRAKWGEASPI